MLIEKYDGISWESKKPETFRFRAFFGRSVIKGSEAQGFVKPNRSPAKRVRFGKEERRSE